MKTVNVKKGLRFVGVVLAMMGISSVAQAKPYAYYCVLYAEDPPYSDSLHRSIATYISMTGKDSNDAYNTCTFTCGIEWSDYLGANYKKSYKLGTNASNKRTLGDAKKAYNKVKNRAKKRENYTFYHASDFSCSGD